MTTKIFDDVTVVYDPLADAYHFMYQAAFLCGLKWAHAYLEPRRAAPQHLRQFCDNCLHITTYWLVGDGVYFPF